MKAEDRLKIAFAISGWPESSGVRIKTTAPTGVYISSKNREAAQWHFPRVVVSFVRMLELLKPEDGGGLTYSQVNWDKALVDGVGELEIRVTSANEMSEIMRTGTPQIIAPVEKLRIEEWNGPQGGVFFMGWDLPGDKMDKWLVESVTQDLGLPKPPQTP